MSKRALLCIVSSLLLPFVLGQACGVTPAPEPFDPLKSNADLRNACGPLGIGDAGIESMLILLDQDRRNGISETAQMQGISGVCANSPTPVACNSCATAIVHQVYGQ